MSPEKRRFDRVLREPSEGGYSGIVKRASGMRLKDGDLLLEREDGIHKNRSWLDAMQAEIEGINIQKRRSVEEVRLIGLHSVVVVPLTTQTKESSL